MFLVAERCVTSFYESPTVTPIQPLMTQPFDFKQRQSIVPRWEELLLFNDNFETVFEMEKNKNVVMFFEIIDFLPMSVANKNYNRYGQKGKYSVTHYFFLWEGQPIFTLLKEAGTELHGRF